MGIARDGGMAIWRRQAARRGLLDRLTVPAQNQQLGLWKNGGGPIWTALFVYPKNQRQTALLELDLLLRRGLARALIASQAGNRPSQDGAAIPVG